MNDLITMDLESPARLPSDDNSSDAIIERADRRARSFHRMAAHKAEVRLAEAAVYYNDMDTDDQLQYGSISRYFFRMRCLEKSQMLMLKRLMLKHEQE